MHNIHFQNDWCCFVRKFLFSNGLERHLSRVHLPSLLGNKHEKKRRSKEKRNISLEERSERGRKTQRQRNDPIASVTSHTNSIQQWYVKMMACQELQAYVSKRRKYGGRKGWIENYAGMEKSRLFRRYMQHIHLEIVNQMQYQRTYHQPYTCVNV